VVIMVRTLYGFSFLADRGHKQQVPDESQRDIQPRGMVLVCQWSSAFSEVIS